MKAAIVLCGLSAPVLLAGCAVSGSTGQSCTSGLLLQVAPASATADHTQAAPGDQVKFSSTLFPTASPTGCPVPQWVMLATPTWTSLDPKDIQIDSSSNTSTNGLATCVGPTNGAATLTASLTFAQTLVTQTASLTCK
jgi:hypothetical protein